MFLFATGRNLALRQPTNQTSTYSKTTEDQVITYTSDLAVDGNTSGDFNQHSCAASASGDAHGKSDSWTVYFRWPQYVNYMLVYNRNYRMLFVTSVCVC